MEEQIREFVVIDPEDLDEARRIATDAGVEFDQLEVKAIDPVTTVTLILMGSSLAVATVVYLLDKHKGGQVIDVRPGAPKAFYRSKDVVYGLVVILATDGKVSVEVKEPKGMFGQVMESIQTILNDIAKAGVEQIAKAIRDTLGDVAEVSVTLAT